MDKVTLSKITILHLSSGTTYPLITLYPEWIKAQPKISFACEDLVGEVISPQVQFSVYFDSLPGNLHDESGGVLYNYNSETEDLICQIFLSDSALPAWIGNILSWQWSQGDQALIMGFVGGLEVLRRLRLEDIYNGLLPGNHLWTEDQMGRPAKWLLQQIYGKNDLSLLFPLVYDDLVYDDYRLSYMEHPERRFCEGQDTAPATPTTNLVAIGYGNGMVWAVVNLDVLSYDPITRLWTYHSTIANPGLLAITGLAWQVLCVQYNPGGWLDILLTRIPQGIVRGTTPHPWHDEVYQLQVTL